MHCHLLSNIDHVIIIVKLFQFKNVYLDLAAASCIPRLSVE